jgi:hypothetical protein
MQGHLVRLHGATTRIQPSSYLVTSVLKQINSYLSTCRYKPEDRQFHFPGTYYFQEEKNSVLLTTLDMITIFVYSSKTVNLLKTLTYLCIVTFSTSLRLKYMSYSISACESEIDIEKLRVIKPRYSPYFGKTDPSRT